MRCTNCDSDQTSLNWLLDHSLRYFCRSCRTTFEVNRGAVRSTARPPDIASQPSPDSSGPIQA